MTERSVELPIAHEWLKTATDVCEIGAVTPYYWPNRIKEVIDPADGHALVSRRVSLFDVSLENKHVLCISVLEHIGMGDYGLPAESGKAVRALDKILLQAKSALITVPIGFNRDLDRYIFSNTDKGGFHAGFLSRGTGETDNQWRQVEKPAGPALHYGPKWANGLIILLKNSPF